MDMNEEEYQGCEDECVECFLGEVIGAPERMQQIMRANGLVLDNLDDPMQKLAFTLYNELLRLEDRACEVSDYILNKRDAKEVQQATEGGYADYLLDRLNDPAQGT